MHGGDQGMQGMNEQSVTVRPPASNMLIAGGLAAFGAFLIVFTLVNAAEYSTRDIVISVVIGLLCPLPLLFVWGSRPEPINLSVSACTDGEKVVTLQDCQAIWFVPGGYSPAPERADATFVHSMQMLTRLELAGPRGGFSFHTEQSTWPQTVQILGQWITARPDLVQDERTRKFFRHALQGQSPAAPPIPPAPRRDGHQLPVQHPSAPRTRSPYHQPHDAHRVPSTEQPAPAQPEPTAPPSAYAAPQASPYGAPTQQPYGAPQQQPYGAAPASAWQESYASDLPPHATDADPTFSPAAKKRWRQAAIVTYVLGSIGMGYLCTLDPTWFSPIHIASIIQGGFFACLVFLMPVFTTVTIGRGIKHMLAGHPGWLFQPGRDGRHSWIVSRRSQVPRDSSYSQSWSAGTVLRWVSALSVWASSFVLLGFVLYVAHLLLDFARIKSELGM